MMTVRRSFVYSDLFVLDGTRNLTDILLRRNRGYTIDWTTKGWFVKPRSIRIPAEEKCRSVPIVTMGARTR